MLLRAKDFNSNFQSAQLDDWSNDDWYSLSGALKQAIQDLFVAGADPVADFESEIVPQLLAALRQYIADGVSLGYSNAPASAAGVYASMSMAGDLDMKRGYLSAEHHIALAKATENIMSAARDIKKRLASVSLAQRYNESVSQPLYSSSSEVFEEKENEEETREMLGVLAQSLKAQSGLRELKEIREATTEENPFVAGVDRALARFIESKTRREQR